MAGNILERYWGRTERERRLDERSTGKKRERGEEGGRVKDE